MRTHFFPKFLGQERVGVGDLFNITHVHLNKSTEHKLCLHAGRNRGKGQKSSCVEQFMSFMTLIQ